MNFGPVKFDNFYDIFIIFILIVKIIHYLLAIILFILKKYNNKYHTISDNTLNNLKYWSERIDFVFYGLISLLIIYIFNPFINNLYLIDYNVKFLLFVFGFIYLASANWSIFLKEKETS
jgi:hypothetical protein